MRSWTGKRPLGGKFGRAGSPRSHGDTEPECEALWPRLRPAQRAPYPSHMTAENWFYKQNGVEHGPVPPTVLANLARNGVLSGNDLVRKESSGYVAARTVRGLVFRVPSESSRPSDSGRSSPPASESGADTTSDHVSGKAEKTASSSGNPGQMGFFSMKRGESFMFKGALVACGVLVCIVPWFGFTSWIQSLLAAVLLGYAPLFLVQKEPSLDEPMTVALFGGAMVSGFCLAAVGLVYGFGGLLGITGTRSELGTMQFVNARKGLATAPFYALKDEVARGQAVDVRRLVSTVGQPAYKSLRSNGQRWFYRDVRSGNALMHITVYLDRQGTRVVGIEMDWPPFWPSTKGGLDQDA